MTQLTELLEQKKKLAEQIEAIEKQVNEVFINERLTIIAQIREQIKQFNLKKKELFAEPISASAAVDVEPESLEEGKKSKKEKQPKRPRRTSYSDKKNNLYWSGYGRVPKWLIGKDLTKYEDK